MKTLIIGDFTLELSNWATSMFPQSELLTNDNFDKLKKSSGVFYTSVADLNNSNINEAIKKADKIIYHKPINDIWSDDFIKKNTEIVLKPSNATF
jgi:hypothetical protein